MSGKCAFGEREQQVLALLVASGVVGLTVVELASSLLVDRNLAVTLCNQYIVRGLVWRRVDFDARRYLATSVVPVPPGVDPKGGDARAGRYKRAAVLDAPPLVVTTGPSMPRCPSPADPRYTPSAENAGQFLRDWYARRAGGSA